MILGGLEAASPLHRFALAVTNWIGLKVANQGVSPTYSLRAGAFSLAKRLENRFGVLSFSNVVTAGQSSAWNAGIGPGRVPP